MAYARASAGDRPAGAAFVYISASHNPIGHNGLKFGLDNGGVLQAAEAADLIARFRSFMARDAETRRIAGALEGSALPEAGTYKKAAYGAYLDFTGEVAFGAAQSLREAMAEGIAKRPVGIVCDFNGSARTLCIDREFLAGLGVSFRTMNDKPGEIVHRIIPEGESLEPCRRFLEELHADDPSFILGYVPDCDGDRGNLVIWDDGEGKARILEAQEVFALSCMAELAHLVWTGELAYDGRGNALTKAALAVNDPTSLRIERIAKAFDVPVFRAEVGEANVVGLARKLREKGCLVRILGEGSNGGTITHPSSVRDPLDTVMALLKLLSVRSGRTDGGQPGSAAGETGTKGLFELWCALSGQEGTYRPDFTLADIIASLPPFVTTGASTADGLLQVKTADHGALKEDRKSVV
jgi:phosphoglucomutase